MPFVAESFEIDDRRLDGDADHPQFANLLRVNVFGDTNLGEPICPRDRRNERGRFALMKQPLNLEEESR